MPNSRGLDGTDDVDYAKSRDYDNAAEFNWNDLNRIQSWYGSELPKDEQERPRLQHWHDYQYIPGNILPMERKLNVKLIQTKQLLVSEGKYLLYQDNKKRNPILVLSSLKYIFYFSLFASYTLSAYFSSSMVMLVSVSLLVSLHFSASFVKISQKLPILMLDMWPTEGGCKNKEISCWLITQPKNW